MRRFFKMKYSNLQVPKKGEQVPEFCQAVIEAITDIDARLEALEKSGFVKKSEVSDFFTFENAPELTGDNDE